MTDRKRTLIVTRGLPASGKTTWARRWIAADPEKAGRVRVNRDDLRAMMFHAPDYSHAQETAVSAVARAAVRALLNGGRDVVTDDTNLRPRYVREWLRLAVGHDAELEVKEFPIHPDEAVARDARRERPVGEGVIRDMVSRWLVKGHLQPIPDDDFDGPSEDDRYEPPENGVPAVVVDIDGTLALNTCGRSYYDLTRVSEDTPNPAVIQAVKHAHAAGLAVVYLTGREDVARDATTAWIAEHVGIEGPLFMRPADDKRKDAVVKRELFDAHVRDRYDVAYVFDDRNQVVKMWRTLGLTVMQVADGDF